MAGSQKPLVLIIHGAWHRPAHYLSLVRALQTKGYEVCAPALATAGWHESVSHSSIVDDVAVIRNALREPLEAGREVVLLCHSYGGIPSTDAAVGETVADRQARGQAGGIKAIIYIAAFALPAAGMSLLSSAGAKDASEHPSWWTPRGKLAILEQESGSLLYSGVSEAIAQICLDTVVPQSLAAISDPSQHGASEVTAPKAFIGCLDDRILPFEGQKAMAGAANAELTELATGHSPFLDEKLTAQIVAVVGKFA